MSEKWDKVKEDWKSFDEYDLKHIWAAGDTLQAETKVLKYENKQLIDRNKYLEGLTDGDVKLITKLQVENGELKQKLKTGSRMLDDWEKSTSHPDSTLINIRNLKKVFAQNTDYVQKEEET